jgi:hypothetical protein
VPEGHVRVPARRCAINSTFDDPPMNCGTVVVNGDSMVKHHQRGRLAGALTVVLVMAGLALGGMASSASASFLYCGVPVPAFTACGYNTGSGNWTSNKAEYLGAGTVGVCEKTQRGATILSRVCGNGWAQSFAAYGNGPTIGYAGNDSQWEHTIWGYVEGPYALRTVPNDLRAGPAALATVSRATAPSSASSQLAVLRDGGSGSVTTIARPNDQVSVNATSEKLCLRSTLATGASCVSYPDAAAGELLLAAICSPQLPSGQIALSGIVPDGVTAVEVLGDDGAAIASAPVASNTFALTLSTSDAAAAEQLQWVGAAGSQPLNEVIPQDLGC